MATKKSKAKRESFQGCTYVSGAISMEKDHIPGRGDFGYEIS